MMDGKREARGLSFPTAPTDGDEFVRTDQGIGYRYRDGRWLATTAWCMAEDGEWIEVEDRGARS